MKKIVNYIKNNKFYVLSMLIGSLCFILQMKFVVLYGDDFSLGITSKEGIGAAIKYFKQNYIGWGGGPTPLIAIVFLMFRIGVWKIFNCAMIITSVVLLVRMITYKRNINKGIIATCIWILIYILNIYISSETLYWVDGNLAYVLTTFQVFIFFYYLYSRMIMKTPTKKYDIFVLILFAFFAGWSGPQAGVLAVLIPLLLFAWVKFIKKEKIKPTYIVAWIFALIGFLVYYLAPGNNARLEVSFPTIAKLNLIQRIKYRVESIYNLMFNEKTYGFASIPFYLLLSIGFMSIIAINKNKEEKNKKLYITINTLSIILISFLCIKLGLNMNIDLFSNLGNNILNFNNIYEAINSGTFSILQFIPYAITSIILVISVILAFYVSYKEKNPLVVISYVCAILGQMMMLLSPYSPLRTTFITIFLLWLCIGCLISIILKDKVNIFWISTLVLAITFNINILLINAVTYFIIKSCFDIKDKKYKVEFFIIAIIFIIISGCSYLITLRGYMINSKIYFENINRIMYFKENKTEDNVLELVKPDEPKYGFGLLVGTDWIENDLKRYFELDENVVLKYEE